MTKGRSAIVVGRFCVCFLNRAKSAHGRTECFNEYGKNGTMRGSVLLVNARPTQNVYRLHRTRTQIFICDLYGEPLLFQIFDTSD